jgi:import inner membrane translocase subunit TIM54
VETLPGITIYSTPKEASELPPVAEESKQSDENPKKPPQPVPFISTSEYKTAPTPADLPAEFDPSMPISFPHILGFLNTPKRLYRFLNRRVLADSIGRETAAIILSTCRPYHTTSDTLFVTSFPPDDADQSPQSQDQESAQVAEQQTTLAGEEKEWHKNVRVRAEGEPERTWLEPVVLDPRIAARMRRFELTAEDEAKARSFVVPEEEVEGWVKGAIRSLGRDGLKYLGFRKEKKPSPVGDEEVLE